DSGPSEQSRQTIASANIGKKTDAGLRHAEFVTLARDAMRAVQGDAHSSAEHESIDERNIRPDEFFERPYMGVARAVEYLNPAERSRFQPLVQDLEIAAAREHRGM